MRKTRICFMTKRRVPILERNATFEHTFLISFYTRFYQLKLIQCWYCCKWILALPFFIPAPCFSLYITTANTSIMVFYVCSEIMLCGHWASRAEKSWVVSIGVVISLFFLVNFFRIRIAISQYINPRLHLWKDLLTHIFHPKKIHYVTLRRLYCFIISNILQAVSQINQQFLTLCLLSQFDWLSTIYSDKSYMNTTSRAST